MSTHDPQYQYVVKIECQLASGGTSTGTGIIVNERGQVVTCRHVIEGVVEPISVTRPHSATWKYRVVHRSLADDDLAVLGPHGDLPPPSATPFALLSPADRPATPGMNVGVYGYASRAIHEAPPRIPCTVTAPNLQYARLGLAGSVQPGDSGGPVVDPDNRVVGIAQVKEKLEGRALCIPTSLVLQFLDRHSVLYYCPTVQNPARPDQQAGPSPVFINDHNQHMSRTSSPRLLTKQVYLCHSDHDADAATKILNNLEASGIKCWHATRDIDPNSKRYSQVTEAIKSSAIALLILSRDSLLCDGVRCELEIAADSGKLIVCHSIDGSCPDRELRYLISRPPSSSSLESGVARRTASLVLEALKPSKDGSDLSTALIRRRKKQLAVALATSLLLLASLIFRRQVAAAYSYILKERLASVAPEMIDVDGDEFVMGDECPTPCRLPSPKHSVTLSSFRIGKYEVTQDEWERVMGSNPSTYGGSGFPVQNVTYQDVANFLIKLNWQTGQNYRLPTEAEWEYAARGGRDGWKDGAAFSGGNDHELVAWGRHNSDMRAHRVGLKAANRLGLYDMSGNVWEWCSDWAAPDAYLNGQTSNPKGSDAGTERVLRGGSYAYDAGALRVTARDSAPPFFQGNDGGIGFRLAQDLKK